MSSVTELLHTKYPLVQAPMNWATDARFVAAVANAGALGVLGPNAGLANRIETILKRELISIMEDFLQADFERATLLPAKYGRAVFASDVSAVIMLWINDGMVESSADLVGMLTVLRDHPLKDIVGCVYD
ncbi:nitronate monooxygenase [Limosilactobacillus fermentum]|uniref:nitronate monooxygenase n=1 Tax=Limosilactobacillus fermentum TaxID=1613 RepID=UPI002B2DF294|nr:nitronate monooxygenase [Limosilactobacillus fermentum]